MRKKAVAILCSDFHATLNAPPLRAAEPSWEYVMRRTWGYVAKLQEKHGDIPIFFAGDLFNNWDAPAELINLMIDILPPNLYCIPGQHDLPNHSSDQLYRSAYWTLVEAGKIHHLSLSQRYISRQLTVVGFPYGAQVKTPNNWPDKGRAIRIALLHEYHWVGAHKYEGAATPELRLTHHPEYKHFDIVACGDNHDSFVIKGRTTFVNCGTMMIRLANEKNYDNCCYTVYDDASVESVILCFEDDVFEETKAPVQEPPKDWSVLIKGLRNLGKSAFDVSDILNRESQNLSPEVRAIVDQCTKDESNE